MPANKAQLNSISTETLSPSQDAQDSFNKEITAAPDPQVKAKKQYSPRRSFDIAYKVSILAAYDACDSAAQRVALLRKKACTIRVSSLGDNNKPKGRYVVGWLIADCESKDLVRQLIQKTAIKQGIQPNQLTLRSDNGPSMTSHTVSQLLDHLGIAKTHNRLYTSDDNPFSESQFKTLKYCPEFPGRFSDIGAAEEFCKKFFSWYNKEHYHSGIAWLTPESVHHGQAGQRLEKRYQAMLHT